MNRELRQLYQRQDRVDNMLFATQTANRTSAVPNYSDLLAATILGERRAALASEIDAAWERFRNQRPFWLRIFNKK